MLRVVIRIFKMSTHLVYLTYFIFISLHGHVDIVRFLLQNGANTEPCDDWNCTPLHNAAGAGHYQIVDLLCEAGARLDARASNKGKTKTTRIFQVNFKLWGRSLWMSIWENIFAILKIQTILISTHNQIPKLIAKYHSWTIHLLYY